MQYNTYILYQFSIKPFSIQSSLCRWSMKDNHACKIWQLNIAKTTNNEHTNLCPDNINIKPNVMQILMIFLPRGPQIGVHMHEVSKYLQNNFELPPRMHLWTTRKYFALLHVKFDPPKLAKFLINIHSSWKSMFSDP